MTHPLLILLLAMAPMANCLFISNASAKEPTYKSVDGPAEAEGSPSAPDAAEQWKGPAFPQSQNFFVGAGLDYFDNFGIQSRYAARLLKQGPIPDITNSVYFEGGVGITFYGTKLGQTGVTGFNFLGSARWDFQLDRNWTFFGDLGVGYNGVSNDREDEVKGGGWHPCVGVGVIASLTEEWAVRADISYQFLGAGILRRF